MMMEDIRMSWEKEVPDLYDALGKTRYLDRYNNTPLCRYCVHVPTLAGCWAVLGSGLVTVIHTGHSSTSLHLQWSTVQGRWEPHTVATHRPTRVLLLHYLSASETVLYQKQQPGHSLWAYTIRTIKPGFRNFWWTWESVRNFGSVKTHILDLKVSA